jgi:NADH-quinone oxidoreductase subunit F
MYQKLVSGLGQPEDIALLESVASNIKGNAFCPLADACIGPVQASLKWFRDEYEYLAANGKSKYAKNDWWQA